MIIQGTRLVGGTYSALPSMTNNLVLNLDAGDPTSYPGVLIGNTQRFNSRACKISVYAVNYNVLRIMNGLGGLAYTC